MRKHTVLLLSTFYLMGCSQDLPPTVFQVQTLKLYVYSKDAGGVVCNLEPGSQQYEKLQSWARRNREGWKSSPATYAPGRVISGEGFNINFVGSSAILNFAGVQYQRPVAKEEYEFLSCNLENI